MCVDDPAEAVVPKLLGGSVDLSQRKMLMLMTDMKHTHAEQPYMLGLRHARAAINWLARCAAASWQWDHRLGARGGI